VHETSFMIDTGAAPNLIKKRALRPDVKIRAETMALSGITDGNIETLGAVDIILKGHPVTLQVVDNNFPISQEGILGSDFLGDETDISYSKQTITWRDQDLKFSRNKEITLPPRSRTIIPIRVTNTPLTEGYIPRLNISDNIYFGEALVRNHNGSVLIGIINTSEAVERIKLPKIQLEEIESVSTLPPRRNPEQSPSGNSKAPTTQIATIETTLVPKQTQVAKIKTLLRLDHLNDEESQHVERIIQKHGDLFQLPTDTLGFTTLINHKIETTDNQPIHTKQYRYPPAHKEEINKQIETLLNNDVICPSTSPYNSPLWVVPKKPDSLGNKRWRMVVDFRGLNEKTIGDAYPLPNITEILDQLGSAKYFSVFDLASGFHQIPMHEPDAPKTAFSTPYGHYHFKRMPFGLKNAPATFQRLMDQALAGLQGTEVFVYLDDIVLYASSLKEHEIKFNKLAERLRKANLKLQPDKCEFLRKEVTYLGHIIGEDGVRPDPQKINAVKNFPRPNNAKTIKQFLGLAGYYRRFIQDFSKIARPLTCLLKKDIKFDWTDAQELAFTTLREALCSQPLLQYPDFSQPFVVTTDASKYAVGGILSQGPVGGDHPIAYTSRLLNSAEQNYSTIEKELLAIVYSVNHFRPYLYGHKFLLVTDHKPLVWLHSVKDPTSRLLRWRLKLAEYEYTVAYKAGKTNLNADALSRNPAPAPTLPIKGGRVQKPRDPHITESEGDSDSDESLFNAKPHQYPSPPRTEPGGSIEATTETAEQNNIDNQEIDKSTSSGCYESDQESLCGTESDEESSSAEIFDNLNEPFVFPGPPDEPHICEVRDNIATRSDNLVIFTTENGVPCDRGAQILREAKMLPPIKDAMLGRAKVMRTDNRYTIALIVKERESATLEEKILRESLSSLIDVIEQLELNTVSVSKSSIDNIPWNTVSTLLYEYFRGRPTQVFVCDNTIIIPAIENRPKIMEENHSSAIGGHKGITKTHNRIKQRYSWPNMREDIRKYIQSCRPCQLKKLVRNKTRQPMILTDTPDLAFDKIAMDVMGPLPTTSSGNTYILTIQDLLTKYSLAIPLERATAVDIADAFTNEFICTYGAPKALLTDQGTNFINSLMRGIARKFRITQMKTTAYHPQSNGSVERSHHVLWEYLKQFVDRTHEWDEWLKLACFSYNTSVHEGTKYTPYELVFGRTARTPSADPPPSDLQNESYAEYLTSLFNRIRDSQAIARENLIISKQRSKRYYDRRVKAYSFKIGDYAYLLKEPNKGKLEDQYVGPYKILEVSKNHNAKIEISRDKTRTVHVNKLKPSREPHSGETPTFPRTSIGGNEARPEPALQ